MSRGTAINAQISELCSRAVVTVRHIVAAIFFYNRAAFARHTSFFFLSHIVSSSLHFAGHSIELVTQGVSPVPADETGVCPVSVCFLIILRTYSFSVIRESATSECCRLRFV